jgi:HEXXH motif-containing protein
VRLALHDENPLALLEAHPEKQGNALSLGDRPVEAWRDALAGALELIARHLPGLAAELSAPPGTRLIPVGFEPERHLSASYREHVGALYLTLHPRVETLAEAIVHEHQHGKLNLASWHDRLLDNPADELVRSPVRPDPRPLIGVLLAAHAFVPVAVLYRRMAAGGADVQARLDAVLASNQEALDVLAAHARPTPLGARVIAALGALHERGQDLGS